MKTILTLILCAVGLVARGQITVNGGLRDGTNPVAAVTIRGNGSGSPPLTLIGGDFGGVTVLSLLNPIGGTGAALFDNGTATWLGLQTLPSIAWTKQTTAGVAATGNIIVTNNPNSGDTVILNDTRSVFTVTFGNNVTIGADAPNTTTNLYQWLNTNAFAFFAFTYANGTNILVTQLTTGINANVAITTTASGIGVSGLSGGVTQVNTVQTTQVLTLSTNATLNFSSTVAGADAELTTPLLGVGTNSDWLIQVTPNKAVVEGTGNGYFHAYCVATNVITVRYVNPNLVAAIDPPNGTFRIVATQFSP